jgi:hypothetical protein
MSVLNIDNILNETHIKSKKFGNYDVMFYNKTKVVEFNNTTRNIRSVVVDNNEKRIVSLSPSKSIDLDEFISNYSNFDDVIVEDFIEGTMINLFWDIYENKWEISTKTTVGGNVIFFSSNTFNNMFYETIEYCKVDLSTFNKSYCYSFVMQHLNNRIVTAFVKPSLWLIEAYDLNTQSLLNTRVLVEEIKGDIKCPDIFHHFSNYSDLINYYNENDIASHFMGMVIRKRDTNVRTKIRNPNYEKIRLLRGNSSNLQYHYFTLVKEDKVDEFLKYYPEYVKKIKKYTSIDNKFINTLYKNYISCYIKKNNRLNVFPKNYKTHMYYIHQIYLNQLKPNKKVVKYDIVDDYVKKLDNSLHMWSVNYDYY